MSCRTCWCSIFPIHTRYNVGVFAGFSPEATHEYCIDYLAMKRLCVACNWSLALWELEHTARALQHLQPDHVVVAPLAGDESREVFWPRKRVAKATGKAKPRSREAELPVSGPISIAPLADGDDEMDMPPAEDEEDDPNEEDITANDDLLMRAEAMDYIACDAEVILGTAKVSKKGAPAKGDHEEGIKSTLAASSAASAVGLDAGQTDYIEATIGVARPSSGIDEVHITDPQQAAQGSVTSRGPRGLTIAAAACAHFPHGRLSYHESKAGFEAVRTQHANCNLSRVAYPKKGRRDGTLARGGRPCGFMAAWLSDTRWSTKAEHKLSSTLHSYSQATRLSARRDLGMSEAGQHLLSLERTKADAESSEPETLDGYA
eukprot:2508399-Amphidinium_carterae.3